ncbi:MAG: amidohydrolase family protein [Saprospiraceae bacterium]
MREQKIFWISDDGKFMCQDSWQRPITDPSFFLHEKLEWMQKNSIDKEVILNLSQLYCNGVPRQTTKDIIQFQNDYNRYIQGAYMDKFIGGFVIQPLFIDDALEEIQRCTSGPNPMKLVCLPSHFLNDDGEWLSVVDHSLKPIFELINALGLAVEIHPYNAEQMIGLKDEFWRFHLIWMCAQTADTWHRFSLLDFQNLYPNMRTCFAHGNQVGMVVHGRRIQGFKGRSDLFPNTVSPLDSMDCANVFVDSIVHDPYSLQLILHRIGSDQIVAGLDDPYPLGEMDSVLDSYPGKVLDDAVALGILSKAQQTQIWHQNVLRWIG